MSKMRSRIGVAILSFGSSSALADAGGPGEDVLTAMYYVFLCFLTVPIALTLRSGDRWTRMFIGVTAPIIGLVMAFGLLGISKSAEWAGVPFVLVSTLPTICLAFFPARKPASLASSATRITFLVATLAFNAVVVFIAWRGK